LEPVNGPATPICNWATAGADSNPAIMAAPSKDFFSIAHPHCYSTA
jgi:hypothetical protein